MQDKFTELGATFKEASAAAPGEGLGGRRGARHHLPGGRREARITIPETAGVERHVTSLEAHHYSIHRDPWTSNVCVAGNLITAQNPQSAEACAKAVVSALA